jgi:hypothetical protein
MFKKISLLSFLLFSISSLNANFSSWLIAAKTHVAGLFKDLPKNYYLECEKQNIRQEQDNTVEKELGQLLEAMEFPRAFFDSCMLSFRHDPNIKPEYNDGVPLKIICWDDEFIHKIRGILAAFGFRDVLIAEKPYNHTDLSSVCTRHIDYNYNSALILPRIKDLLPHETDMLNGSLDDNLRYTIGHEASHLKNKDALVRVALEGIYKGSVDDGLHPLRDKDFDEIVEKKICSREALLAMRKILKNLKALQETRADVYGLTCLDNLKNPISSTKNIVRGDEYLNSKDLYDLFENRLKRMRAAKAKDDLQINELENNRKHAYAEHLMHQSFGQ